MQMFKNDDVYLGVDRAWEFRADEHWHEHSVQELLQDLQSCEQSKPPQASSGTFCPCTVQASTRLDELPLVSTN